MMRELVALSAVTFTPPSSSAEMIPVPVAAGALRAPGGAGGAEPVRFSEREERTLDTSSASAFSR